MFDLDAYLKRIGLSGGPSIATVHRAHVIAIPFENLDPHRGIPVSLAADDLARKLVDERRGGYCFEQNTLLATALREMGADVDLLLARVRGGADPTVVRPQSHLVLRARIDGADLHADVGFGRGTLLEPIPFGPGGEYEQSGWRFRVVEEGALLVLQAAGDDGWVDQYAFSPEAVPPVDVEVQNWYVATHPRSPFVTGLVVARYEQDGTLEFMSDWSGQLMLRRQAPTGELAARPVERAAAPSVLASRFGLEGFSVDGSGRLR
jgi:N-hydroxyarylamine O-acetyltransferase